LLAFDAAPASRDVTSTPVASVAPPLYAVFALPFSVLGLRGLIALQVIAFIVCAWFVHSITRRRTGRVDLAWLALATFVLASFSIEYAQGVWPHMLAVALVLAAFDFIGRLGNSDRSRRSALMLAAFAGLCAGAAAGVRYQNVAIAGLLGLTLLVWHRSAILPFVLGLALPLFVSGAMNANRIGSWNPISKGPGYTKMGLAHQAPERAHDAFTSTWARAVDFTAWPQPRPDGAVEDVFRKHPVTGAFQQLGGLKKALLQSSPWALVSLLAVALAWRRRRDGVDSRHILELRRISLLVAGVLGMFALYGFRHDGLCFNQRYLLELMPLLSIALAIALADLDLRWKFLAAGATGGVVLGVLVTQLEPGDVTRQLAVMKAPLVLAAAAVGAWLLARRPGRVRAGTFTVLLGVNLGWAGAIHLREDLVESRKLRDTNRQRLNDFEAAVPAGHPIAIIAYYGNKDAFGPLTLDRDVVIVDPWIDRSASIRLLVDAMVAQGRTIFVAGPLPGPTVSALSSGYRPTRVERARSIFQLVPIRP
jgi:hypothetical protein